MRKYLILSCIALFFSTLYWIENLIVKKEDVGPNVWCSKIFTYDCCFTGKLYFDIPKKAIKNGGTKGKCYTQYSRDSDLVRVYIYPKTEPEWHKWKSYQFKVIVFKGEIEEVEEVNKFDVYERPITRYVIKNPEFIRRKHLLDYHRHQITDYF